MSEHTATVRWSRGSQPFTDIRYSRKHVWSFDGGAVVAASASPAHVPLPFSDAASVDPEEAFVAALSSCHMLVFLHLAAKRGLVVDRYEDASRGYVTSLESGRATLTRVELRPSVAFAPATPCSRKDLIALHENAHRDCFLAGALRAELVVTPQLLEPDAF